MTLDTIIETIPASSLAWAGIVFCISQSAIFSGLNLAVFGVSRLALEVEAQHGNRDAARLLRLRKDSNFLLATILWGNVGINVLLTLLSDSVLTGLSAFLFSTVVITFLGEIFPQAYFSRNALRMASLLAPLLRLYQLLLFPIAKPVALILDLWLGKEGVRYFQEKELHTLIKAHTSAEEAHDIGVIEGIGALNFLEIDDMRVHEEGQAIAPDSIVTLPVIRGRPALPAFAHSASDPFLKRLQSSGKKWVIITDPLGEPRFALDADGFLRSALFDAPSDFHPLNYMHRPIVVRDPTTPLGEVIARLKADTKADQDDIIAQDLVLLWSDQKRIITGADILGRLLRGMGRTNDTVGTVPPKSLAEHTRPPGGEAVP